MSKPTKEEKTQKDYENLARDNFKAGTVQEAKIEFKTFPCLLRPEYEQAMYDVLTKVDRRSSYDKHGNRIISNTGFGLLQDDIYHLFSDFQASRDANLKAKAHVVKLNLEYCDAVESGDKNFEIRFNDRAYQKGDYIEFRAMENVNGEYVACYHPVSDKIFIITYVLPYYGLKEGYVALGIKEVKR